MFNKSSSAGLLPQLRAYLKISLLYAESSFFFFLSVFERIDSNTIFELVAHNQVGTLWA